MVRVRLAAWWVGAAVLLAACQAPVARPSAATAPPQTAGLAMPTGVQVTVPWAYADAHRLGLEVRITGYPLPPAAADLDSAFFPITQVTLVAGSQRLPLYRNPAVFGVAEYWSVYPAARFYLAWETRTARHADFRLSFAYRWPEGQTMPAGPWLVEVDLGAFRIETRPGQVLVLPEQGVFTVPVAFATTAGETRTFGPSPPRQAQGLTATLTRVLVNPSVTWFDVCLRYPAPTHWEPVGEVRIGERVWPALQWHYVAPRAPTPEDLRQALQRCFTFLAPISDTTLLIQPFEVGLREVKVHYDDGHTLPWGVCEAARQQVERAVPGARLRCIHITVRDGQPQIWFDILAWPAKGSRQQVYDRMLAALVQHLDAGWYWQIEPGAK